MAGQTLSANIVLSAGGVKKGVDDADAQFGRLGTSADTLDKTIESKTSSMGSHFTSLGNSLGMLGVPFSGALAAIGAHLDEVKQRTESMTTSVGSDMEGAEGSTSKLGGTFSALAGPLGQVGLAAAAGAGVVVGASVKMAESFQTAMTQLQTGAGESQANIKMVGDGILNMAGNVGTSADDLAKGMFTVESAGYHGAAGLQVLQAAAEGAKVGNADLGTVTDAVTSALNSYHMKASDASSVTSILVGTVAAGKMHMQDLAGALSAVLPKASAAGVGIEQVTGAIATMTSQGTSAQQAAQDLGATISSLQNPSQVQIAEMEQLGLSANQVSLGIGDSKGGLTTTLRTLTGAITSQMGPAGTVLLNSFKQSEAAGNDAQLMITKMPASLQTLAKSFLDGSVTQAQWRADMKGLPVDQRELATQFAATANASRGFSDTLKSGSPAAQTFNAALSKVMGGSTGLDTALQLTGSHMATFTGNVDSITAAGAKGANSVQGFAATQKDLSFQISKAKDAVGALGIKLGTALLPTVTKVATKLADFVNGVVKDWPKISAGFETAWAIAKPVIASMIERIRGIWDIVSGVVNLVEDIFHGRWGKIWGDLSKIVKGELMNLDGMLLGLPDRLLHLLESLGPKLGGLFERAFDSVTSALNSGWSRVANFFTSMPSKILSALSSLGSLLGGLFTTAWQSVTTALNTGWSATANFFSGLWGKITGAIGDLASDFYNWMHTAFLRVKDAFVDGWQVASSWLTGLWGNFKSAVGDLASDVYNWAHTAFLRVKDAFVDGWNDVAGWLGGLWGNFTGAVGDLGGKIYTFGHAAFERVKDAFTDAWNDVTSFLSGIPQDITTAIGDIGSTLYGAGSDVIHGLANGLVDAATAMFGHIPFIGGKLVGLFKDALGVHSPSVIFTEMGQNLMQGLALGITGGAPKAMTAMQGVAGAMKTVPFAPPAVGGFAGGASVPGLVPGVGARAMPVSSSGGLTINVGGIVVQGNVLTDKSLTDAVWQGLMQKALVNGTAGQLVLPSNTGT